MGIQVVKQMTAEATVCGQTRLIQFDVDEGVFSIAGIKSFPEAMEVLDLLGRTGVSEIRLGEALQEERSAAYEEVAREAARGTIPLASPVTRPVPEGAERPKFDVPAAAAGAPLGPKFESTPAKVSAGVSQPGSSASPKGSAPAEVAGTTTTSTPETAGPGDDMAVFANMVNFAQVVAEVRKRIGGTAASEYGPILAYCLKLQAIGDVCPPLDQLFIPDPDKNVARLEDRLKTHLTRLGIPV